MKTALVLLCSLGMVLAACEVAAIAADGPAYDLDLDVDYARGTFEGQVDVHYENRTSVSLPEIVFRLYANASNHYGDAELVVTSTRVDGQETAAASGADATVLRVPLANPLVPNAAVDVALQFRGRASHLRTNALWTDYGFLARTASMMTLTAFYPVVAPYSEAEGWATDPVADNGDALFADASTYQLDLEVDSDVTVVPVPDDRRVLPNGRLCCTLRRQAARDLSLVLLGGSRQPLESTRNGLTVRCWFSSGHEGVAAATLELAAASAELYATLFGNLPWPVVDIVEAPLGFAAGVEFAGLFLVSNMYGKMPVSPYFEIVVTHELAHQWFYAAVGNDPHDEPWLDEALATFASSLALRAAVSDSAAEAMRAEWLSVFALERLGYPELGLANPSDEYPDTLTYLAFVYYGGALAFDELRLALGDEAFFATLADYYHRYTASIATAKDLVESFARAGDNGLAARLFGSSAAHAP